MDYLFILIADILLAVVFTFNKIYQKHEGSDIKAGLKANCVIGAFCSVIFFALSGFRFEITPYSLVMALLMTAVTTSYSILGYKVLKQGKVAIYAMFLMAGGMTLPYIWGLFFAGEEFSILRTIGLIIILVSVVLTNFDKSKPSKMQIILCIIIFFLNGCSSIVSKMHQAPITLSSMLGIEKLFENVSSTSFVLLASTVKFAVCGILYFAISFATKREGESVVPFKKGRTLKPLLILLCCAVADGVSYYFQLRGAINLDAGVLYPLICGGSIVATAIAGYIAFREKLSRITLIGIILCIGGMSLFI